MNELANKKKVIALVHIGTFMTTLDVGIVNLVLPLMAEDRGETLASMQWVVTVYLLTMVGLLPILGSLSDRLHRGKVYSAGFLVFALGSLAAAALPTFGMLLAARAVQGIGAAMIMANSQAMVRAILPDRERGKALGVNTIVMSVGTLSGPAVGGFLLQLSGWPLLFWINVPVGIAAAVVGFLQFPDTERSRRPVDYAGAILLAISVLCLLGAAVLAEKSGFVPPVLVLGAAGLGTGLVLLLYERNRADGVVDPILYRVRPIAIGNVSAFLYYAALTATQIPQAFYMRDGLGVPVATVGLVLAVQPIFLGLLGPLSGWSRDRFGPFWPTCSGAALCLVSAVPVIAGGAPTVADFVWMGALFGAGGGLFLASNNAEIMSAAPTSKASLVGSMLALIRYLGMIAGIAAAVLLAGGLGSSAGGDVPQLRLLYGIAALFCLIMLVASLSRKMR